MSDTTLAGNTGGTPTESDRFLELKARAETLGWELLTEADDPSYHPWAYVLHRFGETTASPYTNSAARLDPVDPANPLTGLDSVSHMLDQIEFAQARQQGSGSSG
jgi:hypothetical protein